MLSTRLTTAIRYCAMLVLATGLSLSIACAQETLPPATVCNNNALSPQSPHLCSGNVDAIWTCVTIFSTGNSPQGPPSKPCKISNCCKKNPPKFGTCDLSGLVPPFQTTYTGTWSMNKGDPSTLSCNILSNVVLLTAGASPPTSHTLGTTWAGKQAPIKGSDTITFNNEVGSKAFKYGPAQPCQIVTLQAQVFRCTYDVAFQARVCQYAFFGGPKDNGVKVAIRAGEAYFDFIEVTPITTACPNCK